MHEQTNTSIGYRNNRKYSMVDLARWQTTTMSDRSCASVDDPAGVNAISLLSNVVDSPIDSHVLDPTRPPKTPLFQASLDLRNDSSILRL